MSYWSSNNRIIYYYSVSDSSTILEFSTVSELLQAMSCNQVPSNHTVKIVINDIVQTIVSMCIILYVIFYLMPFLLCTD